MRSSASAGLFGAGNGLASAGAPPATLRRRAARSSSSVRAALRAVTGSETTDQRSRLGSFLSTSAVNTCVPSIRSLGAIVIGHVEQRREILPHVELAILAADEHRDLAGDACGSGFAAAFSTPGRRDGSFFASGSNGRRIGDRLDGLGRFFGGLGFSRLSALRLRTSSASVDLGDRRLVGASAFTALDFASTAALRLSASPDGAFGFAVRLDVLVIRWRPSPVSAAIGPALRRGPASDVSPAASDTSAARRRAHRTSSTRHWSRCAGIRGVGPFAQRCGVRDRRSIADSRLAFEFAGWHSQAWSHRLRPRPCRLFTAGASVFGSSAISGLRHDLLRHQQRMRETGRRHLAGRDDDARAHLGPVPHLRGKRHRHADAAVRRRIARQDAGMHRDARPGDALHERHRRAAVDVGVVHLVLLDDAEHAHRGRMALHARRHRAFGEQAVGVVDPDLLLVDRDRDDQRALRLGAGFLFGGLGLGGWLAGASACAAGRRAPAGSSRDRNPASRYRAASAWGVAPMVPAAAKTAICQNRWLELLALAILAPKSRCPLTRIFLESRYSNPIFR